jgi:putative DNA primase/helicase
MLKAYLVAGCPCQVNLGSFEDWSKLIRSTLIWLGETDPVETMERLRESDPVLDEKRVVMDAWKDLYADRKIEVADIMKHLGEEESLADPQKRENLRTALLAIAGVRGEVDGKRLGFWLRANKDAMLDGTAFRLVGKRQGFAIWSLQSAKVKSTASELSL